MGHAGALAWGLRRRVGEERGAALRASDDRFAARVAALDDREIGLVRVHEDEDGNATVVRDGEAVVAAELARAVLAGDVRGQEAPDLVVERTPAE